MSGVPVSAASLDLIHTRIKGFPSLQNVIVDVQWYGPEFVEESDDEAGDDDGGANDWNHPEGRLAAMLRGRGWVVHIPDTRILPGFDTEDLDYENYLHDLYSELELAWQKAEEEEEDQRQLAEYEKEIMAYADDEGLR
jgi:hypothetical protein